MKHALVTGGCGFAGRALVKKLLGIGVSVTVVDDLSSGQHPSRWDTDVPPFAFFQQDVRQFFREEVQLNNLDTVFHLAAVVGGRSTIEGDALRVATDLSIDAEFFYWLTRQKYKFERIVYFSSSAVYPVDLQQRYDHVPLHESAVNFGGPTIGIPDLTYGWAKMTGEYLSKMAVERYGLPVVIYRPFSGYGAGQDYDYPFPSLVRRVIRRESPIEIWGSGRQLRDFIHMDDVIDAVLVTKDKLKPGEALNLGSGIGTNFSLLAHHIAMVLDITLAEIKPLPDKPEGVFCRVADPTEMFRHFTPKVSLFDGIKRVAAEIRSTMEDAK